MRDRLFVWLPSSVVPGAGWRKKDPLELSSPVHDRVARLSSDSSEAAERLGRDDAALGHRKR